MNIETITSLFTMATAAVPLAFTVYLLVKNKGVLPAEPTPNEKLLGAALRAAQGTVLALHASGVNITDPKAIADSMSKVNDILQATRRETAEAAGADSFDLQRIARNATAEAVKALVPALKG